VRPTPLRLVAAPAAEFTPPRAEPALLAALAAGLAAVAAASALTVVRRDDGRAFDRPLGRRVRRGRPMRRLAWGEWALDRLTASDVSLATAAAAALAVGRRRGADAALPVFASAAVVHAAQRALRLAVRRPRPLLAQLAGKRSPSFPSGHAARGVGLFGLLAHVAVRERLAPAAVVYPAASAVSLVAGLARVKRGRHWATDVVGGLGLGLAAAAGAALWYDRARLGR
jgi:undecaprenyl-diphosphatase